MNKRLLYSLVLSGAIRYFISISKYTQSIENHVEVSTPLNSFKRCKFQKMSKKFIADCLVYSSEGRSVSVQPWDRSIFRRHFPRKSVRP